MMSLVGAGGAMEFYDGSLRVREADGRIALDGFEDQRYRELIDEGVKPWTYMKFPYRRLLGPDAGWYRVGPLARLQNCDFIPTPRAEARRQALLPVAPALDWDSLMVHPDYMQALDWIA